MPHILSTTEQMQDFITQAVAIGVEKIMPAIQSKLMVEAKEVYNLMEAANYLNMSHHTLRKKVDQCRITYIQDERTIQFRKKHLDEYLDMFTKQIQHRHANFQSKK